MTNNENINEKYNEENLVHKRNSLQKRFYTSLVIILTFAIIFSFATFFVENPFKLAFGIASVTLCISFFIVWIIKKSKIKSTYKIEK